MCSQILSPFTDLMVGKGDMQWPCSSSGGMLVCKCLLQGSLIKIWDNFATLLGKQQEVAEYFDL